ncbi:hypothetical protein Q5P01_015997 [Channa striata]|uniref:Uncharacterized protein n=1 Tax=Channa striata TaxID=64152 RepID=A0AA88SL46_CHASR|nr:hypothetical protein Q5P01_015997 [Channa striata]
MKSWRMRKQDVKTNGTVVESRLKLDKTEEEDLETQTLGWSDLKPGVPSGVTSNSPTPISPDQALDKQVPTTPSTPSNAEQNRVKPPGINRSLSSKSQEKREQRRLRGLEHNQRETERAASSSSAVSKDQASPPKSKTEGPSKLKERSDSKELDQYTFVAWKMKEDKGGKKEAKASPSPPPPPPSDPVRPTTLSLQPAEPVPERNGLGEGEGAVTLHRRAMAMKEKPEKWRATRSEGEPIDGTSTLPPPNSKRQQLSESASSSIDSLSPGFEGDTTSSANKMIILSEGHYDGPKGTSLRRKQHDGNSHQDVAHATPSTPDRSGGFFSKILKKRPHKEAQTPDNGDLTLSQILNERPASGEVSTSGYPSRPPSQPHGDRTGKGFARNPSIKISRATRVSEQWNTSLDREITNSNELRHLDEFLGNQVNDFRSRGKQLSKTEAIFVTATMQFRETLKDTCSIQKLTSGYKGLMKSYHNQVIHLASDKDREEVQLVVNLFQSVLDGFIRGEIKKGEAEPAKPTKARKKRRKKDENTESTLGHIFVNYQVNIMQSCDQCNSYIWVMEKAYMCSYCKMVCHKKCFCKIITGCYAKKGDDESGHQHFGVHVCHLVSDKNPVPMVLEMMLEHVEIHGLFVEGIYRKSGSSNRMKELYQRLETEPHLVCLEDYPIHTVTGLVKQWLRELPDPLMTFTRYNDLLHAVELPEKQEQLCAIYKVLEELPPANFNTLERLVFHLVRVYKEEAHNRMSPNSLAIVFAPCILRCPDSADPLLSMKDVAKTTMCVEMLINEQIRHYNETMEKIKQVESAEADAHNQLKLKRQNTHCQHLPLRLSAPYKGVVVREKARPGLSVVPEQEPLTQDSDTETEENIKERIEGLIKKKEDLVRGLLDMEQPGSDPENFDSEASLSSESLLDEQQRSSAHNSEPEGRGGSQLRTCRPVALPKPSNQAQQPRVPDGRVSLPNLTSASSVSSLSSCASFASESSNTSVRNVLHRRNPIIPATVKLPPGILPQPAASGATPGNPSFKFFVRRREQPGRRKDSTQSMYIDSPECDLLLHFSSCPPSASSSSSSISTVTRSPQHQPQETQASKAPRRFSDPDIPYTEDA